MTPPSDHWPRHRYWRSGEGGGEAVSWGRGCVAGGEEARQSGVGVLGEGGGGPSAWGCGVWGRGGGPSAWGWGGELGHEDYMLQEFSVSTE